MPYYPECVKPNTIVSTKRLLTFSIICSPTIMSRTGRRTSPWNRPMVTERENTWRRESDNFLVFQIYIKHAIPWTWQWRDTCLKNQERQGQGQWSCHRLRWRGRWRRELCSLSRGCSDQGGRYHKHFLLQSSKTNLCCRISKLDKSIPLDARAKGCNSLFVMRHIK